MVDSNLTQRNVSSPFDNFSLHRKPPPTPSSSATTPPIAPCFHENTTTPGLDYNPHFLETTQFVIRNHDAKLEPAPYNLNVVILVSAVIVIVFIVIFRFLLQDFLGSWDCCCCCCDRCCSKSETAQNPESTSVHIDLPPGHSFLEGDSFLISNLRFSSAMPPNETFSSSSMDKLPTYEEAMSCAQSPILGGPP